MSRRYNCIFEYLVVFFIYVQYPHFDLLTHISRNFSYSWCDIYSLMPPLDNFIKDDALINMTYLIDILLLKIWTRVKTCYILNPTGHREGIIKNHTGFQTSVMARWHSHWSSVFFLRFTTLFYRLTKNSMKKNMNNFTKKTRF